MSECRGGLEEISERGQKDFCRFRRLCQGRVDGKCYLETFGLNGTVVTEPLADGAPGFNRIQARNNATRRLQGNCDTLNNPTQPSLIISKLDNTRGL